MLLMVRLAAGCSTQSLSCLTHGMQGSQMWAHSALFGMDGLLMAFGGTHLVLLSMSRMPWDTEAEGSG